MYVCCMKEELERHRQQLDQMNQRHATMAQEIDDMNAQSEIIGRSHRVYQEANERLQSVFLSFLSNST